MYLVPLPRFVKKISPRCYFFPLRLHLPGSLGYPALPFSVKSNLAEPVSPRPLSGRCFYSPPGTPSRRRLRCFFASSVGGAASNPCYFSRQGLDSVFQVPVPSERARVLRPQPGRCQAVRTRKLRTTCSNARSLLLARSGHDQASQRLVSSTPRRSSRATASASRSGFPASRARSCSTSAWSCRSAASRSSFTRT